MPLVTSSESAEEKIMFIHEEITEARIKSSGRPSPDFDSSRAWFQDVLRDTIRMSSKTVLISKPKVPENHNSTTAIATVIQTPAINNGTLIVGENLLGVDQGLDFLSDTQRSITASRAGPSNHESIDPNPLAVEMGYFLSTESMPHYLTAPTYHPYANPGFEDNGSMFYPPDQNYDFS